MRVFLLALLFCCQLLTAAAANVPLMPVRDLRAGMQGIGKTVISGDTIETFNVEILGVNGSEAMGYNIFVRLYGDLIERPALLLPDTNRQNAAASGRTERAAGRLDS